MRTFLDWIIPHQPGHPVKVGIVTGEVSETIGLHNRDNQGVAGEVHVPLTAEAGSA